MHGTQGSFLASLAALSLLSITSHHHLHQSHNSITLSRSQVISRQTPAPEAQHLLSLNHGTRATVRNLFGDMPVRVKQRAIENAESSRNSKDWDSLRKEVTALILAWQGPISATIQELSSNTKLRTLRISSKPRDINDDRALVSHICSTLTQASLIPSVDTSSWVTASGSTSTVSIRSGISLDPAPTKGIQFISFGIHPLSNEDGRNILFEEVNRLFANSSFGIVEDLPPLDETEKKRRAEDKRYKSDGFTNKELKGFGKGVDRWPMFYMRIEIYGPAPSHDLVEDVFDDEKTLISITKLLHAVIVEFLRSNNFTPKFIRPPGSPSKRKAESSEVDMGRMGSPGFAKAIYDMPGATQRTTDATVSPKKRAITKLPTRHLSPRPSSPFDIWPRVKSGRVPGLTKASRTEPSNVDDAVQAAKGIQPSGRALKEMKVAGNVSSSKIEKPVSRRTAPLISKSGTVSQLPFMDVAKSTRRPTMAPKKEFPISEPSPDIEKDEIVPWTDPTTKESCFVNMRTGLVQKTSKLSDKPTPETRHRLRTLDTMFGSTRHGSPTQAHPPSDWLNSILSNWKNPVFPPAEPPIPQIEPDWTDTHTQSILHGHHHTCTQAAIDRAFQVSATSSIGRLSKSRLQYARVIAQVDRKFILARMPAAASAEGTVGGEDMLVIIDQHAADERCRIEALMADFCLPPLPSPGPRRQDELVPSVRVERLDKSIVFEVAGPESELLERHRRHFADWGVLYCIHPAKPPGGGMDKVVLTALPPGIVERCRAAPKMAIELVRREAWGFDERGTAGASRQSREMKGAGGEEETKPDWVSRMQGCPLGIVEMLNSRACRGAVMFNDVLEVRECEALVRRLGGCKFPFTCAHGRPSMVPLVGVGEGVGGEKVEGGVEIRGEGSEKGVEDEEGVGFGRAFRMWRNEVRRGG